MQWTLLRGSFEKKMQSQILDCFHKDSENKLSIEVHGLLFPHIPPFFKQNSIRIV